MIVLPTPKTSECRFRRSPVTPFLSNFIKRHKLSLNQMHGVAKLMQMVPGERWLWKCRLHTRPNETFWEHLKSVDICEFSNLSIVLVKLLFSFDLSPPKMAILKSLMDPRLTSELKITNSYLEKWKSHTYQIICLCKYVDHSWTINMKYDFFFETVMQNLHTYYAYAQEALTCTIYLDVGALLCSFLCFNIFLYSVVIHTQTASSIRSQLANYLKWVWACWS